MGRSETGREGEVGEVKGYVHAGFRVLVRGDVAEKGRRYERAKNEGIKKYEGDKKAERKGIVHGRFCVLVTCECD